MRLFELGVVIAAMLVPFIAIKSNSLATFVYWNTVVTAYLAYIAVRRWEYE
jgi:hypothetical protein